VHEFPCLQNAAAPCPAQMTSIYEGRAVGFYVGILSKEENGVWLSSLPARAVVLGHPVRCATWYSRAPLVHGFSPKERMNTG